MKKFLRNMMAIGFVIVFGAAVAWSSSSPGGKTGSPADGASCTQCHNSTDILQSGWISSNIPATGYTAGQTYTITVSGTHNGAALFGFECTAEDDQNNKVGSFAITNSSETRFPANLTTAVTHTNAGTAPSGNSKSWSFDWTAPATGTGRVTFYAAINAADGNMGTGGDQIYTSSLAVEELTSGLAETEAGEDINVYPNPAKDKLALVNSNSHISLIRIYNATGRLVKEIHQPKQDEINIEELNKGIYYLQLQTEKKTISKQFIKL